MDQSEMLTLLGGLYDKLVRDVAAQVAAAQVAAAQVAATTTSETLTADRVSDLAAQVFEERIEAALENYDPSDIISRELDSRDYESEIDSKVETAVEAAVETAIDNIDWDDRVRESCGNLQFDVSVK